MSAPKPLPHRDEFEKEGETKVRFLFSEREGELGQSSRAWLAEKQIERDLAASSKRDAREERTLAIVTETNSIASNALSISKSDLSAAIEQARWAKWAAIVATTALIISNKSSILEALFGYISVKC